MLSDWELWACAQQQISQHGVDAGFAAAVRADELLAIGDLDGQKTLLAILDRINQLANSHAGAIRH